MDAQYSFPEIQLTEADSRVSCPRDNTLPLGCLELAPRAVSIEWHCPGSLWEVTDQCQNWSPELGGKPWVCCVHCERFPPARRDHFLHLSPPQSRAIGNQGCTTVYKVETSCSVITEEGSLLICTLCIHLIYVAHGQTLFLEVLHTPCLWGAFPNTLERLLWTSLCDSLHFSSQLLLLLLC